MTPKSVYGRFSLAEKILSTKQNIAEAVTAGLFRDHPEWETRFGPHGRRICTQDICLHLEFFAGAIEADSPRVFADYLQWTTRMLSARGIDAHSMKECIAQIEAQLAPHLFPQEKEHLRAFFTLARKACAPAPAAPPSEQPDGPLGLTRRAFLAAILAGQRQGALRVVEKALEDGAQHIDLYIDVIAEALHAVGVLWEENKISVAQEHMATAIAQYVVAMIYPRISPPARRGSMVVTGVCGELHQIGPNLVADAMEASGWNVRFLGTNLPRTSILAALEEAPPDVLCISTTLVANLPAVAELIREVRERLKERAPRIVLGGAAYRLAPRFAAGLGPVDVILDLRDAVKSL